MQDRQGRQVLLDEEDKILFSTPDVSMYRTGISSGVGFPELRLDSRHADILVSCVKASMKKIKRTVPYRDKVAASFLRIKSCCDAMLVSTMGSSSSASEIDDTMGLETQTEPLEDRCCVLCSYCIDDDSQGVSNYSRPGWQITLGA